MEEQEVEEDPGYEELEDDFMMIANEGRPALEEEEEEVIEEFDNKGVMIVEEEEEDETQRGLKEMREELKKRF